MYKVKLHERGHVPVRLSLCKLSCQHRPAPHFRDDAQVDEDTRALGVQRLATVIVVVVARRVRIRNRDVARPGDAPDRVLKPRHVLGAAKPAYSGASPCAKLLERFGTLA